MKPSEFTSYPWSSVFRQAEYEIVAQNIIKILQKTGNKFRKLNWPEYVLHRVKDGNFTISEKKYFDAVIPYCKNADTVQLFSKSWKIS